MWPEKSHKILEKWWDVSAFVWGLFKESAKLFFVCKNEMQWNCTGNYFSVFFIIKVISSEKKVIY